MHSIPFPLLKKYICAKMQRAENGDLVFLFFQAIMLIKYVEEILTNGRTSGQCSHSVLLYPLPRLSGLSLMLLVLGGLTGSFRKFSCK